MMGKSRFGVPFLLAAIALLAVTGGPVVSQVTGDIKGHIQDAEGKALSGAAVKLLQTGKGEPREQASDAEGNFHFQELAGGVYIATVSLEGYAPVTCPGARVVGTIRQLQITLRPTGGEQSSSCQAGSAG
jgi:hypothetical protein